MDFLHPDCGLNNFPAPHRRGKRLWHLQVVVKAYDFGVNASLNHLLFVGGTRWFSVARSRFGSGPTALAGTPKIDGIRPFGARRGGSTEVTINGSSLAGNPRLIAPFVSRSDSVDPKRSDGGTWTFRLSVAPEVAVGVYLVRVQTDDGLSNPFLFSVGQLPQVSEKEDNTSFEAAQALPSTPLVVEGEAAGNDVDYFKFAGKKGQVIVVDAQCAADWIGDGPDHPFDNGLGHAAICGVCRRLSRAAHRCPAGC